MYFKIVLKTLLFFLRFFHIALKLFILKNKTKIAQIRASRVTKNKTKKTSNIYVPYIQHRKNNILRDINNFFKTSVGLFGSDSSVPSEWSNFVCFLYQKNNRNIKRKFHTWLFYIEIKSWLDFGRNQNRHIWRILFTIKKKSRIIIFSIFTIRIFFVSFNTLN